MRTKILSALVIGTLIATGATTAQAATSACTYKPATWLPVPPAADQGGTIAAEAGPGVYAGLITYTDSSAVLGYKRHAARWVNGAVTDLGMLTGADYETHVTDVNSAGVVVGFGGKVVGNAGGWPIIDYVPYRSAGDQLEQLPVPAGAHDVRASVIAANGDIWGSGFGPNSNNYKVVYKWPADQPGTVVTPAGFPTGSEVADVDSDGTVAITVIPSQEPQTDRPYTWKNGVAKALPLPSGAKSGGVSAISNGRVVGESVDANFNSTGILWDNGVAKKLPNSATALDINASGLILGYSSSPYKGALWQLTTAIGAVPAGLAINAVADDGSIAGSGVQPTTTNPPLPVIARCS
ncbi:hypothetical protein [Kribbella sp. NPDC006257]|uniref:hypothetical protein n=1 Tax=Kribbella sp. NPDC006257 TaxID=3156738 RepID=UPI0033A7636B